MSKKYIFLTPVCLFEAMGHSQYIPPEGHQHIPKSGTAFERPYDPRSLYHFKNTEQYHFYQQSVNMTV